VYVVDQYHTKSAISVFLLQKSACLKCDNNFSETFIMKVIQNYLIIEC